MKRGDVYFVDENPNSGSEIRKKRPWVIVGSNPINRARGTVVCVPLSSSIKENGHFVLKVDFNGQLVVAICDQIRALDKRRFDSKPAGHVSSYDMAQIEKGLKTVLELN